MSEAWTNGQTVVESFVLVFLTSSCTQCFKIQKKISYLRKTVFMFHKKNSKGFWNKTIVREWFCFFFSTRKILIFYILNINFLLLHYVFIFTTLCLAWIFSKGRHISHFSTLFATRQYLVQSYTHWTILDQKMSLLKCEIFKIDFFFIEE